MRRWLIEKLGGFPDLDAAIAQIKATDDVERKHQLLTLAVKKLFNTIGADDILRMNQEGQWMFQNRPLTPDQVRSLREEAQFFMNSRLWRYIMLDVKYQLNKKMFEESSITMDVMWGKLMLYLNDIIRTRIERMKKSAH